MFNLGLELLLSDTMPPIRTIARFIDDYEFESTIRVDLKIATNNAVRAEFSRRIKFTQADLEALAGFSPPLDPWLNRELGHPVDFQNSTQIIDIEAFEVPVPCLPPTKND